MWALISEQPTYYTLLLKTLLNFVFRKGKGQSCYSD